MRIAISTIDVDKINILNIHYCMFKIVLIQITMLFFFVLLGELKAFFLLYSKKLFNPFEIINQVNN